MLKSACNTIALMPLHPGIFTCFQLVLLLYKWPAVLHLFRHRDRVTAPQIMTLGSPNAKWHLFRCYIFVRNYLPALALTTSHWMVTQRTLLPYITPLHWALGLPHIHTFTCLVYPVQPKRHPVLLNPWFPNKSTNSSRELPQVTKNVSNHSFCLAHLTFQSQMESNLEQHFQKRARASSLHSQKKNN